MKRLLPFIAILLLATGLRFYRIDAQSFWNDEGNSARLSERSVELIIEGTASDVHPPLYYLMLHGWRESVGESEFALRSFSAFAGVILVALVIPLGRSFRLFKSWQLSLAMLLTAISPALIYYSQETRMYMLLPLFAILATVLFERWSSRRWKIAYVVVLTAGLYTHYFFPIVFVVHGVFALIRWKVTKPFVEWLGLSLLSLLLYAPWIPFMLNGLGGNRGVAQSVAGFLADSAEFLLLGGRWLPFSNNVSIFIIVIAVAAILAIGQRRALVWLLLPPLVLIVLGATDAEFYKFMLMLVPFWAIGVVLEPSPLTPLPQGEGSHASGAGFSSDFEDRLNKLSKRTIGLSPSTSGRGGRGVRAGLSFLTVAIIFTANAVSLNQLYHNPAFARDDYRGMAVQIENENHPNAAVLLNAPNQWEVFTYYHDDGAPVYPIPRTRDYAATLAELETIAEENDRLYVLYWGDQQQDPDRWVETWLDANTFKAREEWRGDVRFVTYAVPPASTTEIQTPTNFLFDDKIRLNGYALNADQLQPNDVIQLTLFWEAIAPVGQRYKLFVHLLQDAGSAPIAQKDSEPLPLTSEWVAGTQFVSNVGVLIPRDAAGRYTLAIGWYDALDPTRRLITNTEVDALPLTTIEIVP